MFAKKKETAAPLAVAPLDQGRAAAPQPQPQPQPQQPQPPQAAPVRPKPASMFSQGLTIRGDIVGEVEVHLDCVVLGDVKVGKLIVGPNARIEGALVAQAMEIHGLVIGTVTAQAVRLHATARVDGDITHEQLAIETGAQFQGRSLKFRRPAPPQAQPTPAASQTAAPPATPPSASQTPYSQVSH